MRHLSLKIIFIFSLECRFHNYLIACQIYKEKLQKHIDKFAHILSAVSPIYARPCLADKVGPWGGMNVKLLSHCIILTHPVSI